MAIGLPQHSCPSIIIQNREKILCFRINILELSLLSVKIKELKGLQTRVPRPLYFLKSRPCDTWMIDIWTSKTLSGDVYPGI